MTANPINRLYWFDMAVVGKLTAGWQKGEGMHLDFVIERPFHTSESSILSALNRAKEAMERSAWIRSVMVQLDLMPSARRVWQDAQESGVADLSMLCEPAIQACPPLVYLYDGEDTARFRHDRAEVQSAAIQTTLPDRLQGGTLAWFAVHPTDENARWAFIVIERA